MNEVEKLSYAKMYIDKLANGINPLDDTEIPADDIVNNVRLSRCFFYISDILRQVIESKENDKTKSAKSTRTPKTAFQLTPEQISKYEFTKVPISASEIVKKINGLIDIDSMKRLQYKDVTAWLIEEQYLYEEKTLKGSGLKRPTELGMQIGISTEMRTGMYGTYAVVVYNNIAQAFILEKINEIIDLKNNK